MSTNSINPIGLYGLCPITMNYHHTPAPVCADCEPSVRKHIAWFEEQTPERQDRITTGAWFANNSLHWAAQALIAEEASK